MVYQFTCEFMDLTLQNESRLSSRYIQAINWSALGDMPPQQVKSLLSVDDEVIHVNLLLVSHFNEMSQLSTAYSVLEKVLSLDRIDDLILMDFDRPLFPTTGPQVENLIPWHCTHISKLSGPLVTCDDASIHCYVAQSTFSSRKNGLAPQFQVLKLFAVGVGAQPLALGFPVAPDNMLVVHAEEKAIPGLFAGMGRKRNKMMAPRSKSVRGCRLIWHSLPPKEVSQVLKAHKGCPYFALMLEREYDGKVFEACLIVIQRYPKSSHKEAISPFLWYHIYSASVQCETPPDSFFLQLLGTSKVSVGFTSHDEAQRWFYTVRFDLDNQAPFQKMKERTSEFETYFIPRTRTALSPSGHELSPGPQGNRSPTMT